MSWSGAGTCAMDDVEPVAVLALGNTLRGDDGLGIRALERLRVRYSIETGAAFIDGGTLGLALLPYLEGRDSLLILDAVASGESPGTVTRLTCDDIPAAYGRKASMHESGLPDLLEAAALIGTLPRRVVLLGMEPERTAWAEELSASVQAALDALVGAAAAQIKAWGCAIVELQSPDSAGRSGALPDEGGDDWQAEHA